MTLRTSPATLAVVADQEGGKFKLSASEWELFTASMDCRPAAKGLNAAARRAIRCGDPRAAIAILVEAQKEFMDYGAWDSEPCRVVADVVAAAYGSQWWDAARYGGA